MNEPDNHIEGLPARRGLMAFFVLWGIGYFVFWVVLFLGYAAWFGSGSGPGASGRSLLFLILAFLPFFYCAASARCCQRAIPRKHLVLLLALSDVSIVAIIYGFAAATAAANAIPLWSTVFGTASVWSPCLAASAFLTIYRLCDAFPAPTNVS
ncbi:MAG: hypothetical protein QOE70_2213 [Chthoniobacter sp.]|jgi:hypothetical protein|nr:hypothetical protein [Chthoniobacter sp.]